VRPRPHHPQFRATLRVEPLVDFDARPYVHQSVGRDKEHQDQMATLESQGATCQGLGCNSGNLIEAHIIPQGFGRFVRGDAHNMTITLNSAGYAKPPLGQYDDQILCRTCDNQLGVFDNYALQVCKRFKNDHKIMPGGVFELADVDGDRFAKFVLAVLWRGSISSRPDYSDVSLGPYEELARDVLFGAQPLSAFTEFQVIVQRYTSKHFEPEGFYSLPVRGLVDGLNSYGLSLAGFRVTAKLDAKPFPQQWGGFIVNGRDSLRGFVLEIERTPEFERIASMMVADHFRQLQKKPRA
jgi:hypothetical protein